MKIKDAAHLIQAAYDGDLTDGLAAVPLQSDGVEAYLLTDGTLVIPGTNDLQDWQRNVRLGSLDRGASRRRWHKGFLDHARVVFAYAAPHKPKRVIGHSLGAAAAQIVGVSLEIPAICFASPRPLRGRKRFANENLVLNINRWDDVITQLPPMFWFRHVGRVHKISPNEPQSSGSHSIPDYLRGLGSGTVRPSLPTSWS